jgi:hypothetical protein
MNAAESKIKKALNLAVDYRNKGSSPTEAVIKAASDQSLSPDMAERLVESFNIALTNATIKNASDKTASFLLAEKGEVMKGVFDIYRPSEGKMASSSEPDSFSCTHDDIDLSWMYGGRKSVSFDNPVELIRKVAGVTQLAEHEISNYSQDALAASMKTERSFLDVCESATLSDFRGKFASFEMRALSEYGEAVRPVIDNIYEATGLEGIGEARFEGTAKIASEYFPPCSFYSKFEKLMADTTELFQKQDAYDQKLAALNEEIGETETLLREALSDYSFSPTIGKSAAAMLGTAPFSFLQKEGADEKEKKPSGGGGGGFLKTMGGAMGGTPFDRSKSLVPSSWEGTGKSISDEYQQAHTNAIESYYKGPKDEVDMEMSNVRRQAILSELMANDDIISKIDPKHIEQSYSTLLSMAPDLTLQPGVVQSWLRQSSAAQSVDPYTAKQLLDLQQGVLKNKAIAKGEKV